MIDTSVFDNKTVAFYTLGCKLNFSETSAIGASLLEQGFRKAVTHEPASLCIINTCSVTDSADKKCRQTINKAIKENPGAYIIVTGCYAQLKPEEIIAIPHVDLVLGANDKFQIPAILSKKMTLAGNMLTTPTNRLTEFHHSFSNDDRTRHFLKVQDGCDYFCSYCTIPLARGRSRNGSIKDLVANARTIAALGGKEIVLTGVNIGDFGHSTNESFVDLLKALDEVEEIERFRISSIEPNLLTDEIIALVANSKRLMPHFHIPLQSGSDEVLELMKRRYTTELFAHKVKLIKHIMPHAFIGVDVIVGVRGETQAYFDSAYSFIESLPISQLHVFSYSERAGTQALKIEHTVSPAEKKLRSQLLLRLSEKKTQAFYASQLGTTRSVLWEATRKAGNMYGFTDNYVRVKGPFAIEKINTLETILLTEDTLSIEKL
ncbi:MAG: tRNA (N(6)-L-threonylcarbamoyladenosine(37)-C(2))-methylthiotransferase MtaB [Paludibacteraceae bacterium]|nr:tRNA (N(6)-L-threonylcarbamoyladenosine(37)-C(2))-methylthiotransferase MtaB [Paludibacteraceae bacterium]MBP6284955.1 tRNA (N(6)-L-threonylcarbamoyladenosine(37)-C(2))-methylthiotransferase MtaB [Paludibacteraceae bacterium]